MFAVCVLPLNIIATVMKISSGRPSRIWNSILSLALNITEMYDEQKTSSPIQLSAYPFNSLPHYRCVHFPSLFRINYWRVPGIFFTANDPKCSQMYIHLFWSKSRRARIPHITHRIQIHNYNIQLLEVRARCQRLFRFKHRRRQYEQNESMPNSRKKKRTLMRTSNTRIMCSFHSQGRKWYRIEENGQISREKCAHQVAIHYA